MGPVALRGLDAWVRAAGEDSDIPGRRQTRDGVAKEATAACGWCGYGAEGHTEASAGCRRLIYNAGRRNRMLDGVELQPAFCSSSQQPHSSQGLLQGKLSFVSISDQL